MKMKRTWKKDFEGYIFFKHSTYQKLCILNVLYKKEGATLKESHIPHCSKLPWDSKRPS